MLNILQVNSQQNTVLCLFPADYQMSDHTFFAQLCHILLNTHPSSEKLLQATEPGTTLFQVGATHYIYIGFFTPPSKISLWVGEIEKYLPPSHVLYGGNICINFTLVAPNEGFFG